MKGLLLLLLVSTLLLYLLPLCTSITPPKTPPDDLVPGYTMNNTIPMEFFYVDDTLQGEDTHFSYTEEQIASYIRSSQRIFDQRKRFQQKNPDVDGRELIWRLPKKQWVHYALLLAADRIHNATIGVFGSMDPWIEVSLIALGARRVITIEYNRLTYAHPLITTLSKRDLPDLYSPDSQFRGSLDMALSISSFDHDGLGRYGDPLSADADLLAMDRVRHLLRPHTGVLMLTVPVGPDLVVFNLHRRYGSVRLPELLRGYVIVDRYGWDERMLGEPANYRQSYEPILLLKPQQETETESLSGITVTSQSSEEEL